MAAALGLALALQGCGDEPGGGGDSGGGTWSTSTTSTTSTITASPTGDGDENWRKAFQEDGAALDCAMSYDEMVASGAPSIDSGATTIFVGFQQYDNNQDPVFARFDDGQQVRIGGANGPAELKKLQIIQVRLGTRSPSGPPKALENCADPLGARVTRIGVAPASCGGIAREDRSANTAFERRSRACSERIVGAAVAGRRRSTRVARKVARSGTCRSREGKSAARGRGGGPIPD